MTGAVVTVPDLVPDAAGTISAWRGWRLARVRGGRFELRPVFQGSEPWPAGEPARASCRHSPDHPAPDTGCSCGLYAVPEPGLLPSRGVSVVGTVRLWGKVVQHARGFRAELGYPQELRLVCAHCGRARDASSMVIREDPDEPDELLATCAHHLRGRRRPAWTAGEVLFALLSTYGVGTLPDRAAGELRGLRAGLMRARDRVTGAKATLALTACAMLVATLSLSLAFGLLLGAG